MNRNKNNDEEYLAKEDFDLLGHPITKTVLITGAIVLALYLSKPIFNAAAGSVTAYKGLRDAIKS